MISAVVLERHSGLLLESHGPLEVHPMNLAAYVYALHCNADFLRSANNMDFAKNEDQIVAVLNAGVEGPRIAESLLSRSFDEALRLRIHELTGASRVFVRTARLSIFERITIESDVIDLLDNNLRQPEVVASSCCLCSKRRIHPEKGQAVHEIHLTGKPREDDLARWLRFNLDEQSFHDLPRGTVLCWPSVNKEVIFFWPKDDPSLLLRSDRRRLLHRTFAAATTLVLSLDIN